jgi:vacuolar protein sorting-associated protein 13A/C
MLYLAALIKKTIILFIIFFQRLNLIVQSVGVSLTEVQDVVFRLGFFERTDTFMSWQQLLRDLQW